MRHIISGAVLAAILICGSALAAPPSVQVQGSVPTSSGGFQTVGLNVAFADLDISSGSGAATLLQRIDSAARVVCKPINSSVSWSARQFESCRKNAVSEAVEAVGSPALTQATAAQ